MLSTKTSVVAAMHNKLCRRARLDLCMERGNVVIVVYLSFVVSLWLVPKQESWIHVCLDKHIAMLTPERNGNAVGDVSSPPKEKTIFHELLVQGIVFPALGVTMEMPINDDQPAAMHVDANHELVDESSSSSNWVRFVPTQCGRRLRLRGHLKTNAAHMSTEAKCGLENVLVHFQDINGEWLHSDLFNESQAMQHVKAELYYAMKTTIEPDTCYRLVWQPQRRGPYPPRCGEHAWPFYREHSDLNSDEDVHRTEDRQMIVTCLKTKVRLPAS